MEPQAPDELLHLEPLINHEVWRAIELTSEGIARVTGGGAHGAPGHSIPLAWRVTSSVLGPHTVVLGGIHGNELCGVHAVRFLLERFSAGTLQLSEGQLTVAVGNVEAILRGQRYVGANMNRQFRDDAKPQGTAYEQQRVSELKALLRDDVAFLLDLHATSAPSEPYAMIEQASLPHCAQFGFERVVSGWAELSDSSLLGDTQTYVETHGGVAITMENGQLSDPASSASAIQTCHNVLARRGITGLAPSYSAETQVFHMTEVHPLLRPDFAYRRAFKNLEPLTRGELIGEDSVSEYRAPTEYDAVMILPGNPKNLQVGENLFHFGRILSPLSHPH
jgi:predicted deacylase